MLGVCGDDARQAASTVLSAAAGQGLCVRVVNDYEGPGRAKEELDSTIITKTVKAVMNVKTPPYTAFRFCFLFMSL